MTTRRADLTFKRNLKQGRHGWLRLTPAYSIKVVDRILNEHPNIQNVLEPFSGTGTTGLVCGERGIACDLFDINPFLVWFARVKTANYTSQDLELAKMFARDVATLATNIPKRQELWTPPIKNIERWWTPLRLDTLARIHLAIAQQFDDEAIPARNLLLVAFCRLLIDWSNAAFNHQSMSFKDDGQLSLFGDQEQDQMLDVFVSLVRRIAIAAGVHIPGAVRVFEGDSRLVRPPDNSQYDALITSPPYPNRMSYIRELRPYMYWLGYLQEAREAGELDWQAIGGTWGIATSRVGQWEPDDTQIEFPAFQQIIASIRQQSAVLSNYVHKYFVDISKHIQGLHRCLVPGAQVFYVVGNSKFYDTLVPVELIYKSLLRQHGFKNVQVETIRKRNSKKELFEYIVSATAP